MLVKVPQGRSFAAYKTSNDEIYNVDCEECGTVFRFGYCEGTFSPKDECLEIACPGCQTLHRIKHRAEQHRVLAFIPWGK